MIPVTHTPRKYLDALRAIEANPRVGIDARILADLRMARMVYTVDFEGADDEREVRFIHLKDKGREALERNA